MTGEDTTRSGPGNPHTPPLHRKTHGTDSAEQTAQKILFVSCITIRPAGGIPYPGEGTGEGQGEPYHAQRSFTHGEIQPRPAAGQNPIKGGEAQAEKTIKEAVP